MHDEFSAYPPRPRAEAHWPPQLAVLTAIGLQLLLPNRLTAGPLWLLPGLETLMLAGLVIASPQHLEGEHAVRRRLALLIASSVSITNGISLVLLAQHLLDRTVVAGRELIVAGAVIWLTNILIFGLWYWEIDRGGPGRRAAGDDALPGFLFPQMTLGDLAPQWRPMFIDYLYVSLTNAAAFSPTDTMPLTGSIKAIMGLQSLISLVTIGLVVARAVNIL